MLFEFFVDAEARCGIGQLSEDRGRELHFVGVSHIVSSTAIAEHTPLYSPVTPLFLTMCAKVLTIVLGASGVRVCNRTCDV